MSNVLFVKANDRPADQAVSVQMYDAFLQAYKAANPDDQITELDLFNSELPYYNNAMMTGLFKQANGMDLDEQEKSLTATANGYLDQFLAADKVVFAFPLWNFTVPAQLTTYLFYLAQGGKTFKYTPEGPVGLAGDKKVALLNARGGVYSAGPAEAIEMSMRYVRSIMNFFGITNLVEVIVEGHQQKPDEKDAILEEGRRRAAEAGASF
ncbi:FMN-dependent NADH-azoreductase [Paenibacillus sp. IB182496]|uniref:FMN dependent NADH:quinone oxidoreductase n=1 Tax=Paenibacillus sabuli TaxID=2772509 RepID=A0A927GT02_9BACL|nr:FMN-dependent NADH-azoreductase [Paenibacillus sabuli]MBD2847098.1 FMN-dependent NADH-azoreductase [Paenibacillus sabuli]